MSTPQRKERKRMSSKDNMNLEEAVMALTMRVTVIEKLLIERGLLKDEDFTAELQKIVDHLQEMTRLATQPKDDNI